MDYHTTSSWVEMVCIPKNNLCTSITKPDRILFLFSRFRISSFHRSPSSFLSVSVGWVLTVLIVAGLPGAGFAKTVTDQLGRSVTLPDSPRRIVSLAPSITEILYALHLESRLVGATQFSDYPQAAVKLPKVGSYVRLDIERIVSLAPDLCIAVKDGNPLHIIQKLETLGVAVYAVDPRNLTAVRDTVVELGKLLDAGPQAEAVAAAMDRRIKAVQGKLAHVTQRPEVFFQIGISPIVSAGTPTFINELITLAGGRNLARGPIPYPRFSTEQVIAMGPEVIIITSMARKAVFEQVKDRWRQWPDLPAVKNNRIHLVNSDIFDRASPRLVEGVALLARLIHPTCFKPQKEEDSP
jgi:iron complex transport system substrate-binding protein